MDALSVSTAPAHGSVADSLNPRSNHDREIPAHDSMDIDIQVPHTCMIGISLKISIICIYQIGKLPPPLQHSLRTIGLGLAVAGTAPEDADQLS